MKKAAVLTSMLLTAALHADEPHWTASVPLWKVLSAQGELVAVHPGPSWYGSSGPVMPAARLGNIEAMPPLPPLRHETSLPMPRLVPDRLPPALQMLNDAGEEAELPIKGPSLEPFLPLPLKAPAVEQLPPPPTVGPTLPPVLGPNLNAPDLSRSESDADEIEQFAVERTERVTPMMALLSLHGQGTPKADAVKFVKQKPALFAESPYHPVRHQDKLVNKAADNLMPAKLGSPVKQE